MIKYIAAAALSSIATLSNAATFTAMFDGFCDGVSVTIGSNGVAYGTEIGCASGPAVGTMGFVKKQGSAYVLSLNHLPNTIYVLRPKTSTWSIYQSDGSELQSGTFTQGLVPNLAGGTATGF